MENEDTLAHICSLLENDALLSLSKTSLWLSIRNFASSPYFWYMRVQFLLKKKLLDRPGSNWKEAYYSLSCSIRDDGDLSTLTLVPLSVSILLEIKHDLAYPSCEPLFDSAVENGQADTVKVLLAEGECDMLSTSDFSSYYLIAACRLGYAEVVKALISDGRCTKERDTPLIEACRRGHTEVMEVLLQNGADPNAGDGICLELVCKHTLQALQVLLKDGRIDCSTRGGLLLLVTRYGSIEMIKLAIAHIPPDTDTVKKCIVVAGFRLDGDILALFESYTL